MLQIITTDAEFKSLMLEAVEFAVKNIPQREPTQEAQIITGEDLSKKLGITIQTLIRWRQKGKIPFLQIGNSIRYDLHKVLDSLEAKKKGAKK
jgi:transcriptional regulator with XRE-family HTH domain